MMMLRIKRAIAFGILLFSMTFCGAAMVFARPEPFFAFSRTVQAITIYDTQPIPQSADRILSEIAEILAAGPFEYEQLELFVARDGWRHDLFFWLGPKAGGIVYYPLTYNHGFLSGADYRSGLLRKGERLINPPRTLVYYGVHELTHVLTGQHIGAFRFHAMPDWVREGLADYVALGQPQDYVGLDAQLGNQPISVDVMDSHGAYPRYRMLVAWFLTQEGWSLDALLATDMSESEALAIMREGLAI